MPRSACAAAVATGIDANIDTNIDTNIYANIGADIDTGSTAKISIQTALKIAVQPSQVLIFGLA